MAPSSTSLEDEALEFANSLRRLAGLSPRDVLSLGRPQDSCHCPIARTAGAGWAVTQHVACRWERGLLKDTVATPPAVARFIDAFDAGELPALVIP